MGDHVSTFATDWNVNGMDILAIPIEIITFFPKSFREIPGIAFGLGCVPKYLRKEREGDSRRETKAVIRR